MNRIAQTATQSPLPNELTYQDSSLKFGALRVNVKSFFYAEKSLYDILYSLVSVKLKEKSA